MFARKCTAWLLFSLLLASCEKHEDFGIESHGSKLSDLPHAPKAPVFEPEYGVYAELVRDGEVWQAYISGQLKGRVQTEDEINEFGDRFRDHAEAMGCESKVLISADREMPCEELQIPIRALAASGICNYYFNTRNAKTVGGSGKVHAPKLDLSMGASVGSAHPILVKITAGGSIYKVDGQSTVLLDEADAGPLLPGLNRTLTEHGEEAKAAGLRPGLQVLFMEGASYERFVQVLTCAQLHDAYVGVVDADAF
ncbi:MAG: hypothetical protein R3242_08815 [Akkermansiaceae bacterium]|nr:hypothetical protein [Akkermansiaceae bacterium]